MTISQRASALIADVPRDPTDRDRLREEWRLAAVKFTALEDNAGRLEEGRKVLLDQLTLALIASGTPATRASMEARTSEQFKRYLAKMFDAKREAADARIEMQVADRRYWEHTSREATERIERRMSR